jgi:lipopolysaccharide transport system ATP-binding protein
MNTDVVIRADCLGKKYTIGHQSERERYVALRDVIGRIAGNFARRSADLLRGRPIFTGDNTEEFWALKDVNFEIQRGEVVGIIGRNGAGKSTLLKILSRITEPTAGRVTIKGRVASLLEVGTGFHGELTGRENIYLNGAILGMRRAEIRRRFEEIVAFAEIERFLDTPVKRYSSGMYVRLAFAVAAHLEPEILLVDEVLAVGDAEFQRKSLGKMSDVARGGRTVFFVSHNLAAIRRLCSHAFLLENGSLAFGGSVDTALTAYERLYKSSERQIANASFVGPLAEQIKFDRVICKQGGVAVSELNSQREIEIELHYHVIRPLPTFDLSIALYRDGLHITSCYDSPDESPIRSGHLISKFNIPAKIFKPGIYTLGIGARASSAWVWGADVAALDFPESLAEGPADRNRGVVGVPYTAQRIEQNIVAHCGR